MLAQTAPSSRTCSEGRVKKLKFTFNTTPVEVFKLRGRMLKSKEVEKNTLAIPTGFVRVENGWAVWEPADVDPPIYL